MPFLNYRGDVRSIVGEVLGPDTGGGYVRAVEADYDTVTDRTRVRMRRLWGDELTTYLSGSALAPIEERVA